MQLDEAYFGTKSKQTIRTLFMGKQIDSRKLVFKLLEKDSSVKEDAWDFLKVNVTLYSTLATDRAVIYRHSDKWWPV